MQRRFIEGPSALECVRIGILLYGYGVFESVRGAVSGNRYSTPLLAMPPALP
jgi:hypothetical protein